MRKLWTNTEDICIGSRAMGGAGNMEVLQRPAQDRPLQRFQDKETTYKDNPWSQGDIQKSTSLSCLSTIIPLAFRGLTVNGLNALNRNTTSTPSPESDSLSPTLVNVGYST